MMRTMSADDITSGTSAPLGATVLPGGVNFSVFSKHAVLLELLLFEARMPPSRQGLSPSTPLNIARTTTGMSLCRTFGPVRCMRTGRTASSTRIADLGLTRKDTPGPLRARRSGPQDIRPVGWGAAWRQCRCGDEERRSRSKSIRLARRSAAQ